MLVYEEWARSRVDHSKDMTIAKTGFNGGHNV